MLNLFIYFVTIFNGIVSVTGSGKTQRWTIYTEDNNNDKTNKKK